MGGRRARGLNLAKLVLISALLAGAYGCPAQFSDLTPVSIKSVIPTGAVLKVALTDAISTDRSMPGDHFSASLAEAVVIDGKKLLEIGTQIRGRVFDLREPHRLNAAALYLILTEIMYDGKVIAITTRRFEATPNLGGAARGEHIHFGAKARLEFILAAQLEI